ncbi:MAG TPA: DNA-directed RNA polymerase subunit F [bacterium]|nr:DNA-directed RNA polymerase subunit F [bacterium]
MIGKKIIVENNVPLHEVKTILSERNKDGELSYEQQAAFDYSKKFAKITPAKGEKLLKGLQSIEGLTEDLITKITDLVPADLESVQLILYKSELGDDIAKQILEVTSKYAK